MKRSTSIGLIGLLAWTVAGCTGFSSGQAQPTAPAWINQHFARLGDLTTDRQGNVYLADWVKCRVEKISPTGHLLRAFGSFSGCVDAGAPTGPVGVALDANGNLWVSDAGTNEVTEFSPSGKTLTKWNAHVSITSIAVSPHGEIVLSNVTDQNVAFFTHSGKLIRTFGSYGLGPGKFSHWIATAAFDQRGNLYVADHTDHLVQKFAPNGRPLAPYALGSHLNGLALDTSGNVYVQAWGLGIIKISPSGHISTFIAGVTGGGIAVDPSGNVWSAEENGDLTPVTTRLVEYAPSGKKLRSFAHPLA